jgi:hypothetical protein
MLHEALANAITDKYELNNNFLSFLFDARNETTQNALISTKRSAVIFQFKIAHTV